MGRGFLPFIGFIYKCLQEAGLGQHVDHHLLPYGHVGRVPDEKQKCQDSNWYSMGDAGIPSGS